MLSVNKQCVKFDKTYKNRNTGRSPPYSVRPIRFNTRAVASLYMRVQVAVGVHGEDETALHMADEGAYTAQFTRAGGKLMIEHNWMEEPPQMEDRNELIYGSQ
jgi:hypothetical protein